MPDIEKLACDWTPDCQETATCRILTDTLGSWFVCKKHRAEAEANPHVVKVQELNFGGKEICLN